MGIVKRQSIKNTIINYFGVVLGALSTFFIYPLDIELYGKVQIWFASASLLMPFLTLGSISLLQKFFPYFRDKKYNGFLKVVLSLVLTIIVFTSIVLFFIKGYVLNLSFIPLLKKDALLHSLNIIYPLSVVLIFINIFRIQAANLKRIVVPDLFQKIGLKFFLPLIFLALVWGNINDVQFRTLLLVFHLLILLFLIFYVKKINGFDVWGGEAFIQSKKIYKKLGSYMSFSAFNQIGYLLAYQIDKIMLGIFLTNGSAGIYTIFLFLTTLIDIPTKAVYQISGPIVSQKFEKNDLLGIEKLYKESSINLLLIGVFIFSMIWLNLDIIFEIMSKGELMRPYKILFLFLGIAKLMDMLTSLNGYIIIYSKYYRVNLFFVFFLAISNIITNYYFIQYYGLIGAGIATALSIVLYNIFRTLFIYLKYKIHPFSKKQIALIFVLAFAIAFEFIYESSMHFIFDSIVKSLIFLIIFLSVVIYIMSTDWLKKLFKIN